MKPIRVLLADDHALVRAGFRVILRDAGIDVIGEAADGREAVALVQRDRPTVVLMDIMMPGLNGLDATSRIVGKTTGTHVIILSMNASKEFVLNAMQAGARGYLLKTIDPDELIRAIQAVHAGDVYLCSKITQHVIDACKGSSVDSVDRLTLRQREVLQLIAEGKSTKEIAKTLGISLKTAEGHRSQLMQTLDIHEIAGLVRYAIRTGVVSPFE